MGLATTLHGSSRDGRQMGGPCGDMLAFMVEEVEGGCVYARRACAKLCSSIGIGHVCCLGEPVSHS